MISVPKVNEQLSPSGPLSPYVHDNTYFAVKQAAISTIGAFESGKESGVAT